MRRATAIGAASGGALLFVVAGIRLDAGAPEITRLSIVGAALGAIVVFDLTERRIPNRITLPAAVVCALFLASEGVRPGSLLGGLAVVGLILGLSLAEPASFGMGDVKLALLVALGLGGPAPQALLLGLILAAAFGGALVLRYGRSATTRSLPLAPFVGAGAAVVVFL